MIEVLDKATEVLKLTSPLEYSKRKLANCIYFWKRDNIWLYIGASRRGTERLYDHAVVNKKYFLPGDALYFYFINKLAWKDILAQERRLIAKYNPVCNVTYNSKYTPDVWKSELFAHTLKTGPPTLKIKIRGMDLSCPFAYIGGKFGYDYDKYTDCEDCSIRYECKNVYLDDIIE